MRIPKKTKVKSQDDVNDFIEWLCEEAEERGIALAGFSSVAPNDGRADIEFEPFHTNLSIKNMEKIDKKAMENAKAKVIEDIIEELKSSLDIYANNPITTALNM